MRFKHASIRAHSSIAMVGLLVVCAGAFAGLGVMVDSPDSRVGRGMDTKLYDEPDPEQHPLRKEYPELFSTEAVVVTFSAEWCAACLRQAAELRGHSARYNILAAKIEVEGKATKWSELMERWGLGDRIPVTVVVEQGAVIKTFHGYTPWRVIKPHAGKAKKDV